MRFIISPAKRMKVENNSFEYEDFPRFLDDTKVILEKLREFSHQERQILWKCNSSIATENNHRIDSMNLEKNLSPALLTYEGIQYQNMAPAVFETEQFSYIQSHLRILSGFYGILNPFDGVTPYRLEMASKISVSETKNLYDFWGKRLAETLMAETDTIVNLASKEYSKAVLPHLNPNFSCITCVFGEENQGKWKEKGTLCKMARGQMIRWAAENNIQSPQDLQGFRELGFEFRPDFSTKEQFIFIKPGKNQSL